MNFEEINNGINNRDFLKLYVTQLKYLDTPYYYESIMHYPVYNGHGRSLESETMKPLKPPFEIKSSEILSNIDIIEIRKLYNCKSGKY
jgi:hypothetical protein